ncbi:hypothetical protein Pmani_027195 [Petrolisthes manimaculis]|uniref:Uncharacterized protein n=1 Tax=Petrolisthes manimaculis TaxID=1843537 RepID=A0AAE1P4A6_9EUCA|nr:hypothetical protein Pmani_027195 [Petrolisthes manimaculis]
MPSEGEKVTSDPPTSREEYGTGQGHEGGGCWGQGPGMMSNASPNFSISVNLFRTPYITYKIEVAVNNILGSIADPLPKESQEGAVAALKTLAGAADSTAPLAQQKDFAAGALATTASLLTVVGANTTITTCACNHLTSFGSGFFVALNAIDFSYVFANAGFLDNLTIYLTLIISLALYFIGLVYARIKGRRRKLSLYWWLGSCVLLASVLLSSSSGHMAFSLVMPK